MVTRNDQEYERRRQQIIDGAVAVFSAKGFEKATNRDIAQAAGIGSPGLIYHYFENKTDLLHQAVASRSPALQTLLRGDALQDLPPRAALRQVGSSFLATMNDPANEGLFRILVGEALRNADFAEAWSKFGPRPAVRSLARYLEGQMQAGRLRQQDPVAAANCFLGPLLMYALLHMISAPGQSQTVSQEILLDTVVEIFMQGLEIQ